MILNCPLCGAVLPEALKDGLSSCLHCDRVFNSSPFNKLMSAAWFLKKSKSVNIESLTSDMKLNPDEMLFVYTFIIDNCYSVEDFRKVLVNFGVKKTID